MSEIAVIGAGAWGTGLSIVLGRKGSHRVRLWAHEGEVRESIAQRHVNEQFLPGQHIPESVTASNNLAEALTGATVVVERDAVAALPLTLRADAAAPARGHDDRQRDQRSGGKLAAAHD